jgi:Flp pilus assembly protein TadG
MVREYLKNNDGVAAIEFALVATPFVFMIIGIIEMALMFTSQSLLEASTTTAARQIRTGQIQQAGGDMQGTFRTLVCDFADVLIPCDSIQFQVVNIDSFQDAEDFPPPTFDEDGNLEDQTFDPGGASDIVMIRAVYRYPIVTPLMAPVLNNDSNGNRLMMSTIVLQTEPYEFGG